MSSEPASQTPRKRTTTTLVLGPQGLPRGDALEASLVGISGAAFGHRFLVGRDLARLGRDPECEIRIDDGNVSRFHAEIVRLGTRFVLRDTGSKNGTYRRDEVIEETELVDGDLIRVGESVLKFLRLNHVEAAYHEQIARLTNTDGLTGAYNRRHAWDTLEREMATAHRFGTPLSIVMFDIDHFKSINDTHGHAAGDLVLKGLVQLVATIVRPSDSLCRIGGEEFLIILPNCDVLDAAEVASRARLSVEQHGFRQSGTVLSATISSGVAEFAELDETWRAQELAQNAARLVDLFVEMADAKLYEAKHLGRNRVVI